MALSGCARTTDADDENTEMFDDVVAERAWQAIVDSDCPEHLMQGAFEELCAEGYAVENEDGSVDVEFNVSMSETIRSLRGGGETTPAAARELSRPEPERSQEELAVIEAATVPRIPFGYERICADAAELIAKSTCPQHLADRAKEELVSKGYVDEDHYVNFSITVDEAIRRAAESWNGPNMPVARAHLHRPLLVLARPVGTHHGRREARPGGTGSTRRRTPARQDDAEPALARRGRKAAV
jgi:hypothetical protein